MFRIFYLWLCGLFCLFYSLNATADCRLTGVSKRTITVPLSASIYAGEDVPVGTILYSVLGRDFGTAGTIDEQIVLRCDPMATTITTVTRILTEPQGSAFTFPGNPFNGSVYKTNVEGIGVALLVQSGTGISNSTITLDTPRTYNNNYSGSEPNKILSFPVRVFLVKTGPVMGGGTVSGASMPTLSSSLTSVIPEQPGLPMNDVMKFSLSGSVNILSSTCQPVNKVIHLGEFNSSQFKHKGSATPWVDSSIELINCPSFIGYYTNSGMQTSLGGGAPTGGTRTDNILLVSVVPNTGILDDESGIMDTERSDSAARGLGIQIGYGNTSSSQPWAFSQTKEYIPGAGAGSSVKIPMVARYYQTEDLVTPGRADGVLTYTINYN